MGDGKSIFLFIDLNSYFATAEQQANVSLRGKPVGVCEHSGGIILAPSREAKTFGIKTGMASWEAKKICPNLILLPVDPDKIRVLTSRFYKIAEDYSNAIEHVSVDEVSINLTGVCFSYQEAVEIAREIKRRLSKEMGDFMTASIGIAESRLLAKIGTDLQKPDGLVVISEQLVDSPGIKFVFKKDLYDLLELEDVPGIGSRLAKRLAQKGITTLRQLSAVSLQDLHAWYGIGGVWLYDLSHLEDAWRYVDLDRPEIKSIGHQYALGKRKALYKKEKVEGLIWKLTEKVTARLRKQGVVGSTVSVYLGFVSHQSAGGSRRVQDFFDDTPTVVKIIENLIKGWEAKWGVSFVAVTVSGLIPKQDQGLLFDKSRSKQKIPQTIDLINQRFGDFSVQYGPTMQADHLAGDTIGFGRTRERHDWQEDP